MSVKSCTALIMAIKLNKVALKIADVILFNPQPNVYLKKSEEMCLGLHHSRSISLLHVGSQFFPVLRRDCFGQHLYTAYVSLEGP